MRHTLKVLEGLKSIWLWAIIAGVVILLFASGPDVPSGWNYFEKGVIEVTAPVQKLFAKTSRAVKGLWEGYFFFVGLREENERLRKQVEELSKANSNYKEMLAAHERLTDLLQLRRELPGRVVASRVIGRDPTGWFKSIIIDKGQSSGIEVNMPVTHAFGVIGRIVAVSPNYSKVLLIIDQNSSVDCLIQTTRERGMFKGFSAEVCSLDYVTKSSKAKPGDTVVTSGLGGVFPKGLPLGEIISVRKNPGSLFKDINARPLVDFSKLEEVLVVIGEDISTVK
ncbi:MAG: rod shape-determining protein MreC [Desulfatiglandaceae bacterium]